MIAVQEIVFARLSQCTNLASQLSPLAEYFQNGQVVCGIQKRFHAVALVERVVCG